MISTLCIIKPYLSLSYPYRQKIAIIIIAPAWYRQNTAHLTCRLYVVLFSSFLQSNVLVPFFTLLARDDKRCQELYLLALLPPRPNYSIDPTPRYIAPSARIEQNPNVANTVYYILDRLSLAPSYRPSDKPTSLSISARLL